MNRARISRSLALRVSAYACVVLMAAPGAQAAEGLPGATVRPDAAKARDGREQWCKDNPDRCREMQAKMKERQEQCKADPAKCREEREAQTGERFQRADENKDGKLTREEAQKGMPFVARRFDQLDANKDGVVTMDEIAAARKARAEKRKDKTV